jgi:hypothetical protein
MQASKQKGLFIEANKESEIQISIIKIVATIDFLTPLSTKNH